MPDCPVPADPARPAGTGESGASAIRPRPAHHVHRLQVPQGRLQSTKESLSPRLSVSLLVQFLQSTHRVNDEILQLLQFWIRLFQVNEAMNQVLLLAGLHS